MMDGQKLICLHGPAGCGKTTVLSELQDVLAQGSRTVVFDCYGAGRYRFSDDKRHLPEHAFLQIANDLAVSVGTPFFMPRSAQQPIEIRQLLKRVRDAALVIEDSDLEGLLVIVIDAADNAVTAAELVSGSERCFVHELVGADLASLPVNVRLVISSRTGRISSLRLPRGPIAGELRFIV